MGLREEIESHQVATTWVALGIVGLACLFVVWRLMGGTASEVAEDEPMAYFYDQNTGKVFEAPGSLPGPIETESGPYKGKPAGVRAHVFACGQCRDKSKHFVGWLEISPVALGKSTETDEFTFIRRPDDEEWVRSNSRKGGKIIEEATTRCDGARANICRPVHTRTK